MPLRVNLGFVVMLLMNLLLLRVFETNQFDYKVNAVKDKEGTKWQHI